MGDPYTSGRYGFGGYDTKSPKSKQRDAYNAGVSARNRARRNAKRKKKKSEQQHNLNEGGQLEEQKQSSIDKLIELQEDANKRAKEQAYKQKINKLNNIIESVTLRYDAKHPEALESDLKEQANEEKEHQQGEDEKFNEQTEFYKDTVAMEYRMKYLCLMISSVSIITYLIFELLVTLGFTITGYISIATSIANAFVIEYHMYYDESTACNGKGHYKLFIKRFSIFYALIIIVYITGIILMHIF